MEYTYTYIFLGSAPPILTLLTKQQDRGRRGGEGGVYIYIYIFLGSAPPI